MSILKKALAAARSKSAAPTGDLTAETEALKRQLAEEQARTARYKSEAGTATQKAEQARVASERELIRSRITTAASKLGAVKPEEIADLLSSRCRLESGKVISAESPDQDHEAFTKSYLEANPHHQKSTVSQGSGATPFPGAAPSPPPKKTYDVRTGDGVTAAFHDFWGNLAQSAPPRQ